MQWPVKPKELDLHPLEERLIAFRIHAPFMQIRKNTNIVLDPDLKRTFTESRV